MAIRSEFSTAQSAPNYTGPFITVTALHFIFGFITTLNMALVPHLRLTLNLDDAWAMLADSVSFLAYFAFSVDCPMLIRGPGA